MDKQNSKTSSLSFADLKSFDKTKLRKTDTTITNRDGTRVVESKGEDGMVLKKSVESGSYGFVVDTALDLQVAEIDQGLKFGSQDVAHDFEVLKNHGVTHILNVASGVKNMFPDTIKYKDLEWRDVPDFPIFHGLDAAIEFIELGQSSGGCVFVHCNAGISRAASVVMAYLIKKKKMTVNDAFSYVRSKRPAACPNPGFIVQLETFYERLYDQKQNTLS